ncbi:MAG: HAMP domain-containing sensor histidine kinase [Caldilineaceae bacterium]
MNTKEWNAFQLYIWSVTILGFAVVVWGIVCFPSHLSVSNFVMIALLACVAQLMTTTVPVGKTSSITFEVGNAVVFGAIPLYGPAPAAVAVAIASLFLWLVKRFGGANWKGSWQQLGFNTGMWTVAIFISGEIFFTVQNLVGAETLWGATIPWLLSAAVFDQINFWLLMLVLRLQHGATPNAAEIWRENRWAIPINVFVIASGGALLAYAVIQYDWIGVAIFFLPVFLSAFAFGLYVRQMKTHLDHLEEIIAERTLSLSEANEHLQKANEDLKQYSREKDRFLAILSHDMRAPLTSIGLYAGMLERRPDMLQDKRIHMAQVIKVAQQELADLVTNILELEGMQSGQMRPLKLEPVDLCTVVTTALQTITAQAEAKEIELTYNTAREEPGGFATDREYLMRILLNLLSNAVKYSPKGSAVCVTQKYIGNSARIEIADSGYGIPAEDLAHIFEPFRRVDKHKGRAQGTGLGLSIVKQYVEYLDGNISVSSKEGVGTVFTIVLPTSKEHIEIETPPAFAVQYDTHNNLSTGALVPADLAS